MSPAVQLGRLRGGLVGLLVGVLAVAAHGVAGGGVPGSAESTLVLLAAVAVGGVANVFATGPGSVLVLLGLGQLAGHLALSGLVEHAHPTAAVLSSGWLPLAHVLATVVGAVLISAAARCYAVVSGAVRTVLARPRPPRVAVWTRWSEPGLARYRCPSNGAIGPRAPPVPS